MDNQTLNIAHFIRARQFQVAHFICLLVAIITRRRQSIKNRATLSTRDEILQRRLVREEMLHDLSNSGKCRDLIRMSATVFTKLCSILKRDGGLRPTQRMSVEEQVARFMHILVLDSMTPPSEQSSDAKKYKCKRRKVEKEDDTVDSNLMNGINNVANAIQEGNRILERVYHQEYSGADIYEQLEPMGLEPDDLQDAMMFLSDNQSKTRFLFSCPVPLRMGMLTKMMGGGR